MDHSGEHSHHHPDLDWAEMAAHLELEGEVLLPYVTETAGWLAGLFREDGVDVRRILDIGSGPGLATCELARCFPSAAVIAVDGSSALLEMAAARSEAAGVSDRVTTVQADLPGGLDGLERADLIWAAMVMHHIGDEVAMLRRLRGLLNPGGLLVLAEHGDPLRFLPDDCGTGRPGLAGRLGAAGSAWLAAMREDLPDSTPSDAYPTMLEAAGFQVVGDRLVHVRLDAPLPDGARRVVLHHLQRSIHQLAERLEREDRDALDTLVDEDNPLGVRQRDDLFLDASRHITIARVSP